MQLEKDISRIAHDAGQGAVDQALERFDQAVEWKKRGIELANDGEKARTQVEVKALFERRGYLQEIAEQPLVSGDPNALRRRLWWYRALAAVLFAACTALAYWMLRPFGLGWEAWPLSLAIGFLGGFFVHWTLRLFGSPRVVRILALVALLISLAGIGIMAVLRGSLLKVYLTGAMDPEALRETGDFYTTALPMLTILMVLFGISIELALGLVLEEARKLRLSITDGDKILGARKEVSAIDGQLGDLVERFRYLENEAKIIEAEAKCNFYLGMFDRVNRNGLRKLMRVLAILFLLRPAYSAAGHHLDVVTVPDLTLSVGARGYDGKTDYEKNMEGVSRVISMLPPGARFTVLAVTDRSFQQPYVLLSKQLPEDRGPLPLFDQVAAKRRQIETEFHQLTRSLQPRYRHSDIFGVLLVAADILHRSSAERKVVILLSDMRHSTPEIDIERPAWIDVNKTLALVGRQKFLADMQGIEVYVLGVGATGKSATYWKSLQEFWVAYFQKAKADLKVFSMSRDLDPSIFRK